MSPYGLNGPGLEPRAEVLPLTPAELLAQSIARFNARGVDGVAIARRAAANLKHWRIASNKETSNG